MEPATPRSLQEQPRPNDEQEETHKLPVPRVRSNRTGTLEKRPPPAREIVAVQQHREEGIDNGTEAICNSKDAPDGSQSNLQQADSDRNESVTEQVPPQKITDVRLAEPTLPDTPALPPSNLPQATAMSMKQTLLLLSLLFILLLHALNVGPELFSGSQGWASVLGGPVSNATPDLLKNVNKQLQGNATPGTKKQALTPQQYIDLIVHNMTLDQKLGQMMMVQFTGPDYSPALNTMLAQYNVGAVLLYYSNNNILNKMQLKNLDQQMQQGRTIPLAIAIDQEGGQVDRLLNLDGPRPAASTIGATNDPARARAAGLQDAQDLSSYGINLN